MALLPVSKAMSCNQLLRRSPNPGVLTAATFKKPLSLFTTRVARASPSTSSAMMSRGLLFFVICSSNGSRSFLGTDFAGVNENVDVLEGYFHAFGVSDEER